MTETARVSEEEAKVWYDKQSRLYGGYAECVSQLLETLLRQQGLPYHSITCRTKERDSFLKKYGIKQYPSPESITDLAGVRVIAYTTADVARICELIKQEFSYDRENSVDKGSEMEENQVGYLSVHYIAMLNDIRAELGEYKPYAGLKCEIQVRTLLQHAWAEIEHDRNYKFGGVLPKEIRRRFYLVAGTLELMDQEFQNLSDDIDEYAKLVNNAAQKGSLDIPIDTISLTEFMRQRYPDLKGRVTGNAGIIQELSDMGVATLADLERLLQPQLVDQFMQKATMETDVGLLRTAMILQDAHRYFDTAWNQHWNVTDSKTLDFWRENGADVDYIASLVDVDDFFPGD